MNAHAGRPMNMNMPRMNVPPPSSLPPGEQELVYRLINEIGNPQFRKEALVELSKRRETIPELGPMLWHSFGTVAILLQEIISVYPCIASATFTINQTTTVCNALALLQVVASHHETRPCFLSANIHRFVYPFLEMIPKNKPSEFLKLTALGVIGALVRHDEQEVVNYLLSSEIIPYCLRNMELGNDKSKTVATFILQKILLYENGLNYVCQTYERFSHVAIILGKLVHQLLSEKPTPLLKHVIHCYMRLSENPRAREALRQCIPDQMRDNTFFKFLSDDECARNSLTQLQRNLELVSAPQPMSMPVPEECMPYVIH